MNTVRDINKDYLKLDLLQLTTKAGDYYTFEIVEALPMLKGIIAKHQDVTPHKIKQRLRGSGIEIPKSLKMVRSSINDCWIFQCELYERPYYKLVVAKRY